jgi:hypothetical protein
VELCLLSAFQSLLESWITANYGTAPGKVGFAQTTLSGSAHGSSQHSSDGFAEADWNRVADLDVSLAHTSGEFPVTVKLL